MDSVTGVPEMCCVRGNINLESFHGHMRAMMPWSTSLKVVHYRTIPLHFDNDMDSVTGVSKMRCVRGDINLEDFDGHMRAMMSWSTSPKMVHYQLLKHD